MSEIFNRQRMYFDHITSMNPNVQIKSCQEKLENSVIAIIGLGGIGSNIAVCLAQSGVKKLILIDDDNVEQSNISRCSAYTLEDIGEAKSNILRLHIDRYYPWSKVIEMSTKIHSKKQLESLFSYHRDISIIVNCTDNIGKHRYAISDYCHENNLPFIRGGYSNQFGGIGPFYVPSRSYCQRCTDEFIFPNRTTNLPDGAVKASSNSWITTTIAGLVVNEIVGFLTGATKSKSILNYLQIDFANLSLSQLPLPRNFGDHCIIKSSEEDETQRQPLISNEFKSFFK